MLRYREMAYLDFQHSSRVYLIASDGTSGHDAAIGVVMQFHQITDEITHIALLQPDRSKTGIQRGGYPSDRLLHLSFERRCDLRDGFQRGLILCDRAHDVATQNIEIPAFAVGLSAAFEVAELLEVCTATEEVRAVDDTVAVSVVVAAQDEVQSAFRDVVGELFVVRLTLVRDGDDDLGAFSSEFWRQLDCCSGSAEVFQIGRDGVESCQPFSLYQPDHSDFDPV
jgi:hypothetical protein